MTISDVNSVQSVFGSGNKDTTGDHDFVASQYIKVVADVCIVPMASARTNIEGDLVDICRLSERCEARLAEMGVPRTFFTLIFSTRRDKEQSMADKMTAVT